MRYIDFTRLTLGALSTHRLRSSLTVLGIAIGIAAVVLLTSIGEGVHRFVLAEFTQFGSTLVAINPGRTTTHGASVGIFGTIRPLTIEDARALQRVPHTQSVVPVVQGNAEVEGNGRQRRTTVYGVGPEFPEAFRFQIGIGRFLPHDDPRAARAFVVLGSKTRDELFGESNPLGARVRIGGDRYRVIGVMESKGQVLGFDLDDTVYIPTGRALEMFNREGVMEIDLMYREGAPVGEVVAGIRRILIARHGREDFTITTQQQMLDVLGSVLDVLTFAVGALGGISLVVGGVGILTIMTIAVQERTSEIGLLRALGAHQGSVLGLFLGEAVVLAALGGLAGLVLGVGGAWALRLTVPALPVHTPWSYVLAAELLAAGIGLAAGVLPARRAARLDPIEALRAE
ncbi:MAG: FtsX-like permease family protein [Gammaproteobacteria bacterium]|nr:FtsX-like permease family protein [Gammaproteobacteria bacterium]NIR31201.1 FtsX-like permease family protein [Gammaproteobacteria bacterium]NIR98690.1 FtsX-like permease family protein [Gammaproteobacteria bacterium]NIT64405.1 FtsX-like permease family protein [Gammaproteobacteria bacterium]NIV21330.1 FtsX-like permease family protein [Gammaproteobacteria bacterium]